MHFSFRDTESIYNSLSIPAAHLPFIASPSSFFLPVSLSLHLFQAEPASSSITGRLVWPVVHAHTDASAKHLCPSYSGLLCLSFSFFEINIRILEVIFIFLNCVFLSNNTALSSHLSLSCLPISVFRPIMISMHHLYTGFKNKSKDMHNNQHTTADSDS